MKVDNKRMYKRYVFWTNIKSFHLSPFLRALAESGELDVSLAFEEEIPQDRRDMGWVEPDFGSAKTVDVRVPENWNLLTSWTDPETCHAFGYYYKLPAAGSAFKRLKSKECGRVWVTEAFEYFGWRGLIRKMRAAKLVRRDVLTGFHRVFAMGQLGTRFFQSVGVPTHLLREFAYCVSDGDQIPKEPTVLAAPEIHRFLFVGQLIHRKGVDLLLQSLSRLKDKNWILTVVGDGYDRSKLERLSQKLELDTKVSFVGNCSNQATRERIQAADTLILPSRWDGWGAVVNEALMSGTKVIASNACGAAGLLTTSERGLVFRRGNVEDLAMKLRNNLDDGQNKVESRRMLRKWSVDAICGGAMARYFRQSCESPVGISPPWN